MPCECGLYEGCTWCRNRPSCSCGSTTYWSGQGHEEETLCCSRTMQPAEECRGSIMKKDTPDCPVCDSGDSTPRVKEFTLSVDADRIRHIAASLRSENIPQHFGTKDAEAFLLLFGDQLQDLLTKTIRIFVEEKLTAK